MDRVNPDFCHLNDAPAAGRDPALEQAMLAEPSLWGAEAALYRVVPAGELTSGGAGQVPYLLCRGEEAVAAFQVGEENELRGLPGLLTFQFWSGREADAVAALRRLPGRTAAPYRYAPEPVPEARFPVLTRHRLIQREGAGFAPSRYGESLGLTLGYRAGEGGGPAPRLFWSAAARTRVEALLAGCRAPRRADAVLRLPWEERLDMARAGLTAPGQSRRAVRALAERPLDLYMADFPQELRKLRADLGLSADATYGEAARKIDRLLCSPSWNARAAGRKAMLRLVKPLCGVAPGGEDDDQA